jgi:hypothetical protein
MKGSALSSSMRMHGVGLDSTARMETSCADFWFTGTSPNSAAVLEGAAGPELLESSEDGRGGKVKVLGG